MVNQYLNRSTICVRDCYRIKIYQRMDEHNLIDIKIYSRPSCQGSEFPFPQLNSNRNFFLMKKALFLSSQTQNYKKYIYMWRPTPQYPNRRNFLSATKYCSLNPLIIESHLKDSLNSCFIIYFYFFIEKKNMCISSLLTLWRQTLLLLNMTSAPKLRAGLMPVPVIGMVARCTTNKASPMGNGAKTYKLKIIHLQSGNEHQHHMITI